MIVFSITLVLLLGLFAWAISFVYLSPPPEGEELTIDEMSALADSKRLDSAVFYDEDSLVAGVYLEPPPPPPPEPKKKKGKKGAEGARGDAEGNGNDAGGAGGGNDAQGNDAQGNAGNDAQNNGGNRDRGGNDEAEESARPVVTAAPQGSGPYWVDYPARDAMTAILTEMAVSAGARVRVEAQPAKQAVRIVSTFLLPLMILANLFGLLFTSSKGGGGGIGDVMMFGSIGKKGVRGGGSTVTFDDVAGADEAVAELKEVRDYLRDPRKYEDIGASPPKGVLLVGPPGCGKTLIAKAVAGEAGVPFFSVAGAEFVESLVGVGAARVRDLFARVRAVAPAIVFIDELDAAGRKRGTGAGSGGSDEREQTLNQLLVEMDGFDVSSGIVVIGATNRPDILDPALLRPGRFDRHVTVDQPDQIGRQLILELHARRTTVKADVDFEFLAKRTPGFSGADLANVINEAALLTVRDNRGEIEMAEFEEAVQRVIAGPKKKGRVLTDEERYRAAYHESGHAVVNTALGRAEDVHRVSILARGRGLGLSTLRRETDAMLHTKRQLFNQIVVAMGGMASEIIFFGDPSTGAEQDLDRATELARDMIGRFGMGSRRQRLLSKEVDDFIGSEAGLAVLSPKTHEEIEAEVEALIRAAEKEATRLLEKNRAALEKMAEKLIATEHLEGRLLVQLLDEVVVEPSPPITGLSPGGNGQVTSTKTTTRKS